MPIRHRRGFSLIELLIAIVVMAVVLAGTMNFFMGQSRTFRKATTDMVLLQNARFATDLLNEHFRAVGNQKRFAHQICGRVCISLAAPVDVLVANRRHHLCRLAVVRRVVAAHDALQLGELAHHVGQQIGLREQRRPIGELLAGACLLYTSDAADE